MKHALLLTIVATVLLHAGQLSSEELPQIHKVSSAPFNAEGADVNGIMSSHADRICGFVAPNTVGVELCPSSAQMLYDNENLYISLRGDFRQEFRSDRSLKRSLFSDNNFEVFLKSETSDNYYQIAISEGGLLYTGVGRTKQEIPGIRNYVFTADNHWTANLVIPLQSIGFTANDQKIRFNVCRYNIDMPKGTEQQSSFAVMSGVPNYHVPEKWSSAVMTSASGKPKEIWASSEKLRVNMMPDPGFDFMTKAFTNPDIQRQETLILSNVWIIRATGKAYNFMSLGPRIPMRGGQEYTMKIRARRIGKEGSIGAIQMLRLGKDRYAEGPYPFWNIALTPDFQEYYFPFKAVDRDFLNFAFYRLGTRGDDTGIEIENISLYEGRISPLEIREVARAGVKNIIPGTEIRLPENLYGQSAKPLTALVIGRKLIALADAAELFTGLNVTVDQLAVTDKNSDTYYTPGNPKQILRRLEDGKYDIYMVGGLDGVGERIGAKLFEQIEKNIKKGAGLFWNVTGAQGNFTTLLKTAHMKPVEAEHLLRQALPVEMLSKPAAFRDWSNDPLDGLQEGRYGSGIVVVGKTFYYGPNSNMMFQMLPDFSAMAYERFPWSDFNKAWLARLAFYTAGKMDVGILDITINGNSAIVKSHNLKDGTVLVWRITDKNGGTSANGKSSVRNDLAEIVLPELSMSGNHVFSVHALDKDGKTIDYSARTFSHEGPSIVSLKDVKLYHKGMEQAEIEVVAEDAQGMTLDWTLEDFSGRRLERGTEEATKSTLLQIPLAPLYTNLGIVEIRLRNGKQIKDIKRIAVFAQDRDRKRLLEDFTPAIWNYEPITLGLAAGSDRQLENIGIRSYLLSFYGPATLNSGMGTGFGWVNADVFWGGAHKNGHVRNQQYNTKESRQKLERIAKERAEKNRQLGVVYSILCDEPGMIGMTSNAEVDEHPENIAEYQIRMKDKYGTITNFNQRMGTAYESFEQLKPARLADARSSGKFGEFIEWRNFNVDRWCEATKLTADATHDADPGVKFSAGNSFGESALSSTDYWKLTTKSGTDFSHEYTSMVYQGEAPINNFDEFFRSFRPDMRLWGYTGYFFNRAKTFFQPWWFALHRYGGFTWYGTYTGISSGGGSYNLLDFTGAYTKDAVNLEESLKKSNLLNGLGKLFLSYEWSKNDIAVYYSHYSFLLAFLLGKETRNRELIPDSPLWKLFYSRQRITYALEELLYQYDFVASEQICGGNLNNRKVLFMPGIHAMSDAEVKAVKAFIADGGLVIADFLPGEYDELGKKRENSSFANGEIMLLGTMFDNKDAAQKQTILDALNNAGCPPLVSVEDAAKTSGREAMHFVCGNMHIFAILRDQTKSDDSLAQTFTFPVNGHIYDLRARKYLGTGNNVRATVASGDAAVWGVYPYKVNSLQIQAPETMQSLQDLAAFLQINVSDGKPERHVIHAELVPPQGEPRFFMKRNLIAENGKAEFRIRIADNDPDGVWTLKATDVLTGVSAEAKIIKQ